ncbi:HDOD domain-containing protein [Candidatus Latescibacterota bacterium]
MQNQLWLPQDRKNLSSETLKKAKDVLDIIPQLSLYVQKIIEMAKDENVDSNKLSEVASSDPVLASKILMMVNSTYYGLSHKTDNLRLAIVLLGFDEVRNIAVQCGVMQTMGKIGGDGAYDTKQLWRHSYLVSVCAEMLLKNDDPKHKGVLMTMGILHDIGKFALNNISLMSAKKTNKPVAMINKSADTRLLESEEKIFGLNHAIIGCMLAEKWNLSGRIRDVIEYHHFPSFFGVNDINSEYIEDISTICLADFIVNRIMEGQEGLREPHQYFFDVLGLEPPIDNLITEETKSKLTAASENIDNLV